ncbi:MAG: hypothetical protein Q9207_006344 [Kuettlingeria erythrocarpa]
MMAEPTFPVSPSLSFLPTEVVTGVFAHLHKADLKRVRLVCRYFEEAALPLLYDRLILSNHRANLFPFDNIASRPKLSKHVNTLVYDISWFDEYTLATYLMHLVTQLRRDLRISLAGVDSSAIPTPLEETIKRVGYFRGAAGTHDRQRRLLPWWPDVEEGYRTYHVQNNTDNLVSNRQRVANALLHCPNVNGFEVHASWKKYPQPVEDSVESLLPRYHSSGFLARHWSPFWLRPRSCSRATAQREPLIEDIFDILHDFGKHITHLSIGSGCTIGPEIHVVPTSMHVDLPWVFGYLTYLSLDIAPTLLPDSTYMTEYLIPALRAARGLKYLTLQARNYSPWSYMDDQRWGLCQAFGNNLSFPQLLCLCLSGVKSTVSRFLEFFACQPRLQYLRLDKIDLIYETDPMHADWIGFAEGLRRMLGLSKFSIEWPLRTVDDITEYYAGLESDLELIDWGTWFTIKPLIEQYVLHGGKNPFVQLVQNGAAATSRHLT